MDSSEVMLSVVGASSSTELQLFGDDDRLVGFRSTRSPVPSPYYWQLMGTDGVGFQLKVARESGEITGGSIIPGGIVCLSRDVRVPTPSQAVQGVPIVETVGLGEATVTQSRGGLVFVVEGQNFYVQFQRELGSNIQFMRSGNVGFVIADRQLVGIALYSIEAALLDSLPIDADV